MKRLLLLLALVLTIVPTVVAAQEAGFPASSEPMLRPGDRIQLQVWRNAELSGAFLVSEDGTVQHPLYSQVQVAGVPLETARERLRTFLSRFESTPQFVFVPEFLVYVGGAVRDQNQQFFPEISVGQAITRAGGSTTPSPRFRVRVIREGAEWRENLDGSGAAAILRLPVHSGDQILVEERPTFARRYLTPSLQVIQTVTSLVSTYVFFTAIFDNK
jgi:protein involved in polysaccharide export with SLBB domain